MNSNPFLRLILLILVAILFLIPFLSCSLDPDPGERYAIVYGVAQYVDYPLAYSADDARAVGALLQSRGYSSPNLIVRTDTEATKTNLLLDINDIATKAKPDSLFLFYFSGHGVQWTRNDGSAHEYIFLYDPVSTLYNGGIEDSELMELIRKVPSKRKVVLLDSCNSGGSMGDFPGVDAIPPDYRGSKIDYLKAAQKAFVKYFANVEEGDIPYTEAVVMAAGGAEELTFEADNDFNGVPVAHGLFTFYLLQTPYYADRNHDGWITTLEAYQYIRDQIEKNWNKYLSSDKVFLPRISGGPLDLVIF